MCGCDKSRNSAFFHGQMREPSFEAFLFLCSKSNLDFSKHDNVCEREGLKEREEERERINV